MTTIIVNGIEYIPKDTVFPKTLFENLTKAYSDAFVYGVYDPTCGSALCHKEWIRFFEILKTINDEIGFKK